MDSSCIHQSTKANADTLTRKRLEDNPVCNFRVIFIFHFMQNAIAFFFLKYYLNRVYASVWADDDDDVIVIGNK